MSLGGIVFLSWKALRYRPVRSLLLVGSIALTLYFPRALQIFISESEVVLQDRARSTPLLVGPEGSSIDLTLNSLYFTPQELIPLKYAAYENLVSQRFGRTIPLHARFRAEGAPVIGTSLAYFELRGLNLIAGLWITRLGDCVIGADLAERRNLKPGDTIISSPENIFDLAGVYPLRMRISGVLAPNQTADDDAIFVDLKTTWIIEGLAHGHRELSGPGNTSLSRESDGKVIRANSAVVEFNEVTNANIRSFHFQGDRSVYPLSSVILIPRDRKQHALARAFYQDEESSEQIVIPIKAVEKLASTLFATQRLALTAFRLLGLAALGLALMVFLLSFRLRERELRTYSKIGATRYAIFCLQGIEVAIILIFAATLSLLAGALTRSVAPEMLSKLLN